MIATNNFLWALFCAISLPCFLMAQEEPFECPQPDGNFPIPGMCTGDYYECISGTPYITACPGNAIFDPEQLKCVREDAASCKSTTADVTTEEATRRTTTTKTPTTEPPTEPTTATTEATTPTTTNSGVYTCPGVGSYPIPGQCSVYYNCISGGGFTYGMCPENEVFNPSVSFCQSCREAAADVPECCP